MKSLTLAAGIALLAIPQSTAKAAVLTVGGPLSRLCYESALERDARAAQLEGCTRSIQEESLAKPDLAATFVNRGILHMISGHRDQADSDFDAALRLDGNLADAWLNKGLLRLKDGRGRDALPFLEEGIKRQPVRPSLAYFARGIAYEDMGDLKSAYADLKRAHDLEPRWSLPREYLARYHVDR